MKTILKKSKKVTAVLLVVVMLVGVMAVPASATNLSVYVPANSTSATYTMSNNSNGTHNSHNFRFPNLGYAYEVRIPLHSVNYYTIPVGGRTINIPISGGGSLSHGSMFRIENYANNSITVSVTEGP